MPEANKIAVIVRDRQAEALRVACGLMLGGDVVEIFILDRGLDEKDPTIAMPMEMINELELTIYSNKPGTRFTDITLEEMAKKLLEYEFVVPY
jgi:hypothetical protein